MSSSGQWWNRRASTALRSQGTSLLWWTFSTWLPWTILEAEGMISHIAWRGTLSPLTAQYLQRMPLTTSSAPLPGGTSMQLGGLQPRWWVLVFPNYSSGDFPGGQAGSPDEEALDGDKREDAANTSKGECEMILSLSFFSSTMSSTSVTCPGSGLAW